MSNQQTNNMIINHDMIMFLLPSSILIHHLEGERDFMKAICKCGLNFGAIT